MTKFNISRPCEWCFVRSIQIYRALYRLLNCLPPETRMSFYYSFIYLSLSYNISVSFRANECILKPLISAQKRFIRSIDGATCHEHTIPIFLKYAIPKLKEIYSDTKRIKTFKLLGENKFYSTHNVNTRKKNV